MINTKCVYEKLEPEDGFRLLVMRRWPRGVSKAAVNAWERGLAPSSGLLDDWRKGSINWDSFAQRYLSELGGKKKLVASLMRNGEQETVTLLCSCRQEQDCHRGLLKRAAETLMWRGHF